jgi:putative copper resistance protein D
MSDFVDASLRFAHFASLLGLFGWTGFWVVSLRNLNWLPERRGRYAIVALAATSISSSVVLQLVSIANMMGITIMSLEWRIIEAMVVQTDMGWAFLIRVALLSIATCVILTGAHRATRWPLVATCLAGALMTLGWSGHAAATEGSLGLVHRLNNGVHLIAAGFWLGAIGWFLHLTIEAHRQRRHVPLQPLLDRVHAFKPMGLALVSVITLTGLVNSEIIFGLENSRPVLDTSYGSMLAVKVIAVSGMLAFAAFNARTGSRFALIGQSGMADAHAALLPLRRSLQGEFSLAVVVMALVAILGRMSPLPT